MPNWCENTLTIHHKDPAMMKKVFDAWNSGHFFQSLHPCPQELYDTTAGYSADEEKQKAREAKEVANIEKYGYKNWYDWCLGNWGTKWDIDTEGIKIKQTDGFSESFYSAWSPPVELYEYLKEQGYEINALYYESGMGFCGNWTSSQGDDYHQIENYNAKWIEENIPKMLVSEFNLLANDEDDEDDDIAE